MHLHSVKDIKATFEAASVEELPPLIARFQDDERQGVHALIMRASKRLARARAEQERVASLYEFQKGIADERGGGIVLGIDEVGRGPIAGPLAAGGVVLDPSAPPIDGLDDSKRLSSDARERISVLIEERSLACTVAYVSVEEIDEHGMAWALRRAFSDVVQAIERQGIVVDVILLDGNPVGFDEREVSVVKGDARCASIAAASIIAKVARDHQMERFDAVYPGYGFAQNKGYGTQAHIGALRTLGLSTVHRKSFCTGFFQGHEL